MTYIQALNAMGKLRKAYPKVLTDDNRVGRAINLLASGNVVQISPTQYKVTSSGTEQVYDVVLGEHPSCTCPDSKAGNRCKHRIAAMAFLVA